MKEEAPVYRKNLTTEEVIIETTEHAIVFSFI